MEDSVFFELIRSKKVPKLQRSTSHADLSLQEFEIAKSIKNCDSLDKVVDLVDKFVVYIALAKCLKLAEVKCNGRIDSEKN